MKSEHGGEAVSLLLRCLSSTMSRLPRNERTGQSARLWALLHSPKRPFSITYFPGVCSILPLLKSFPPVLSYNHHNDFCAVCICCLSLCTSPELPIQSNIPLFLNVILERTQRMNFISRIRRGTIPREVKNKSSLASNSAALNV